VPDALFTAPIDLAGRTSDFQVTVPLDLSGTDLVPVTESNITVSVGISAQMGTRQLDGVPVEAVGAREGFTYRLEPSEVALIITAPQPTLEQLAADDVRVTADVSGLNATGTYSIAPTAMLVEPDVEASITILPVQIDVEVESIDTPSDVRDAP
jgi:hypothetical protein